MNPLLALFFLSVFSLPLQADEPQGGQAMVLQIEGAIGPATSDYVIRGLRNAQETGARLVILQMDTPGGLDHSMRDIIKAILHSPVPVVSYVHPSGARAASAGTYILYASHVAAMTPATTLGAATPVRIGGMPGSPPNKPDMPKKKDSGKNGAKQTTQKPSNAMERKMVNDAAAYIRALAKRHGRNAKWAERAVREAVSLSAQEAKAQDVVDFLAPDLADLLKQLDGHQVKTETGMITLHTLTLALEYHKPDWRSKLLAIITNPNIAYILMLIGIYGLIFEMYNPGAIFPGVLGAISLLLALYAFQVLPINYAGLGLLLLGVALMVAEAFAPSFGVLGLGGVAAFVLGSIIMLDEEGMRISLPLIGGIALAFSGFFLWVITRLIRLRNKPLVSGAEEMINSLGEAMEDFEHQGRIWVHGESWEAQTSEPVARGEQVRVVAINGLQLTIKPIRE